MKPEPAPAADRRADALAREHRTGLVTLVFTDIIGSTQLKQELGDRQAVALIQRHQATVRELLADFVGGREISTAGDSFFLVFAKPSDAVKFALLLLARLPQLALEGGHALADRVGIHVGEVVIEQEASAASPKDLYGIHVDICARVMGLAGANQILLTRSAFDNARAALRGEDLPGVGELRWANHGPYLLKGIEEPVEICEVRAAEGALAPPATTEKAHRHVSPEAEPVLGWRPALGQVVPNTKWVLEQKLGEGGFGEVWLGRHQTMKERRVFKFCFRADRVRFLKREMTLFRLLKERVGDHPNIVSLREVYFDEPPFYVEMDYVEGKDLKSWCEAQGGADKVPLEVRLEIVAQVADALQAAHDAGVIHRDVKPTNVLVSGVAANWRSPQLSSEATEVRSPESAPGSHSAAQLEEATVAANASSPLRVQAKLTDFGIGQVLSAEYLAGVTRAGFTQTMMSDSSTSHTGTQLYMAPELLAGKPASTRSDIYSLGVVLYQLLVGDFSRPLTTDWQQDITDPLLREDLKHCFAGNPQERFAGAGLLAKNLRAFSARHEAMARQQAEQAARERAAYRRGIVRTASIAAVIVVVISVLAGFALKTARDLRRNLYFADIFTAGEALNADDFAAARRVIEKYRERRLWEEEFRGLEYRWLWTQCQSEELARLAFHTNGATCAVFSPDGKYLATGGLDQIVTVLDFTTRKIVVRLSGFDGMVDTRAITFSPDSRLLAAKGGTRLIVWSTSTWQSVVRLQGKSNFNGNDPVVFSPDGQTLATRIPLAGEHAAWDRGAVGFWRTADWSPSKPLIGTNASDRLGTVLAYSLDGSLLVCSIWNELQIRDAQSQVILTNLVRAADAANRVLSVAFSRQHMAVGYRDGMLKLFELGTWRELARLRAHNAHLVALAFSPDGKTVATGGLDHAIHLWDVSQLIAYRVEPETVLPLRTLRGHASQVRAVTFTPEGRSLVSASHDGTVKLWDVWPKASDRFLGGQQRPLWFSSTGDELITWHWSTTESAAEGWFRRFDLVRGTEFDLPVRPAQLTNCSAGAVAVSLDAKQLAIGKTDGAMELWPMEAPGTPQVFSGDGQEIRALTFAARGGLLAATSEAAGQIGVKVWDLTSKQLLAEIKNAGGQLAFSFSPDGRSLATKDPRGHVKVWQARTGQELASPDSRVGPAISLAFSPDSQWLAIGSASGHAWLWKIGTPVVELLGGPSVGVAVFVFSPDGRTLIGNTFESLTLCWNVRSRKLLLRVPSYRPGLSFLLLSPDGSRLAVPSRSRERDLELWRFPTLDEIADASKQSHGNP